ncbi:ParB/RepB/Spo0J family partition protein [Nakamurella lactea]|uniref:ParB/RepB/Spo0J family partition protein n=1 Tax=Nakamurella lactea TaxID=459515 RepID=UPI0003FAC003|nr:ParB/RepB/Spo0J family partition protein [Nakamurella lactea]
MAPKRTPLSLADTGLARPAVTGTEPPAAARPTLGIVGALSKAAASEQQTTAALLADIAGNPTNPRSDMGDLTELAASIVESGLVQPLIVASASAWHTKHPDHAEALHGKPWVLIAGHRRLAAAELAGVDALPITVRDDLADATTRSALIENIHRQDLAPLEEAAALDELLAGGLSQRQLAKVTGISQPKISKRLSLLKLPDAAKVDMTAGELTVTDALRLLELPATLHDSVYQVTKDQGYGLDQAIRLTQNRLDIEARDAELVKRLTAEGIRIVADAREEFGGNSYAHHLYAPDDIEQAKESAVCVAVVEHGRAEYYATTPKPWPWSPSPDFDSDRCAGPGADRKRQAEAAEQETSRRTTESQARRTAISAYLDRPGPPTRQLALLAGLSLLTAETADDERLTAVLLNADELDWDAYMAAGIAVATTPRSAIGLALARQFARAENLEAICGDGSFVSDTDLAAGQRYLELLVDHLGYTSEPAGSSTE